MLLLLLLLLLGGVVVRVISRVGMSVFVVLFRFVNVIVVEVVVGFDIVFVIGECMR